jgi:CubicO group peptidase (beta-lactamase class C family)
MGRTNEEKRTHGMDDIDGGRERLTEHLHRLGIENDVPGASVAVLVGGEVVEATFGVVSTRSGVPVTPDTLFMIQSITKIITATMAMQLVDDGLVGLDDSVRSHLPEFRTADREVSGRITLRHLLTHTGGFEGDLWAATTSGPDAVQRFVEDIVAVARQNSDPGSGFRTATRDSACSVDSSRCCGE